MATYDYLAGETKFSWDNAGKLMVLKRTMNTAAIIASNATLTANAKITSGDIIQAIYAPAQFHCLFTTIRVVTACTAGTTVDIGVAGGDEFQDGADVVTVSTVTTLSATDDYGYATVNGHLFTSADTIDCTYKADETAGEFVLYAVGILYD